LQVLRTQDGEWLGPETVLVTHLYRLAIDFAGAGVYQWTSLKEIFLKNCQSPFAFILQHGGFRRDARSPLLLGLRHGGYCVGRCWALMALVFVGGLMNVLWIASIAIFVLLEKALPVGPLLSRMAG
jgi:predicted metal-binding membrane protein